MNPNELDVRALSRSSAPAVPDTETAAQRSDRIFAARARRLAEREQPVREPRGESCLAFAVGGQTFLVPAQRVRAVIAPRHVNRLPCAPLALSGVTEFGGKLVSLLSLALLLGAPPSVGRLMYVMLELKGVCLGLTATQVVGLTTVALEELGPPADLGEVTPLVIGLASSGAHLLSVERLMFGLRVRASRLEVLGVDEP